MRIFLITIFFLSLFASSLTIADDQSDHKMVEIEVIKLSKLTNSVRLIGIVQAKYLAVLKAKTTGIIEWVADAGKEVKAGQEIVRLNNNIAKNSYALAKHTAEVAKQEYERSLQLANSRLITKSDLAAAHITMLDAQKVVQDSQKEYDNYVYTAPFDSIIGVSKYRSGAQVKEGDELVTIYKPDELVVEVNIPENLLSEIKVGQKVFIEGKEMKLDTLQKFIDQKTHMVPALIKYPCESCIIGTIVNVDLIVSEKANVITIPRHAMIIKDGKNIVFTVKDNKAVLTTIEMGDSEKDRLEVTSGLKVGDQLIVAGFQRLHDGQSVAITNNGH